MRPTTTREGDDQSGQRGGRAAAPGQHRGGLRLAAPDPRLLLLRLSRRAGDGEGAAVVEEDAVEDGGGELGHRRRPCLVAGRGPAAAARGPGRGCAWGLGEGAPLLLEGQRRRRWPGSWTPAAVGQGGGAWSSYADWKEQSSGRWRRSFCVCVLLEKAKFWVATFFLCWTQIKEWVSCLGNRCWRQPLSIT